MKTFKLQLVSVLVAVALLFNLWLIGCGGGGGGTQAGPSGSGMASGKVLLPAGFKLPMSQLQVVSATGSVAIGSSGAFSVPVSSPGPRIVQLVDKVSGKIVLLGYVDSASTGSAFSSKQGDVSIRSTADALLFLGLMGGTLPIQSWSDFLTDIRGSSQETQVEPAISTAVIANPTAITDGDQGILNAVAAVQNTYAGPSDIALPAIARAAGLSAGVQTPTAQIQTVIVRRSSSSASLVQVDPTGPQSGLIVEPNPTGAGIVPVSTTRRRGALFTYKVGVGPDTQHISPIYPPQPFLTDVEVEPTIEIRNVLVGLTNGLLGKFAYLPLTNPPILLPPDPVNEIAVYDVVMIGSGTPDNIPTIEAIMAPDDGPNQKILGNEWEPALTQAEISVAIKDMAVPLLIEMALGGLDGGSGEANSGLETALETASESAPGFKAALASGDIKGAVSALFVALQANVAGIRKAVITALERSLVTSGKLTDATFEIALENVMSALAVMQVINKGIALVDITQAFHDNRIFHTADMWTADVLQPIVKLTPPKSFVDVSDPLVKLTVNINGFGDLSNFRFKWSNTATEGKLENSNSTQDLPTGPIPDTTAVYVTDFTKFEVGKIDTVTVQVFNADDLNSPIGSATATVTAAPPPCSTKPPAPISVGENPPTVTLSETSTHPGDILLVTVSYPGDLNRTEGLEVTLWSALGDFSAEQNRIPATQLLTVDGQPAHADVKDIFFNEGANGVATYHIADPTAAQTHTFTFKMLEPTDSNGNETAYCSSADGSLDGKEAPPFVIGAGLSGDGAAVEPGETYTFFNENP